MGAAALQTIELLSLEDKNGRFRMKLAFIREHVRTELTLDLDEQTFRQLQALNPFSADRVRLSAYASWDPFRQSHYSTLVKVTGTFSETLYFTCSSLYADELAGAVRQGVQPSEPKRMKVDKFSLTGTAAKEDRVSVEAAATPGSGLQDMPNHRYPKPARSFIKALTRLVMLTCVVLVVWFELEGQLHIDDAGAEGEHRSQLSLAVDSRIGSAALYPLQDVVQAYGDEGVVLAGLSADTSGSTAGAEEDQRESSAKDLTDDNADVVANTAYEVVRLEAGTPYYGLPEGYVALTFDDGPTEYTEQIVDIMVEHGVAATFLFVGKQAERYPEELRYAAEKGMAIGNHSWDHSNLTIDSVSAAIDNIARANAQLESVIDEPVTVFRPPYGVLNEKLINAIEADSQMKILMWNRDPRDWEARTSEDVIRYFHTIKPSGGVYVMHEKKATVEALPYIIDFLKQEQLKFAIFQ